MSDLWSEATRDVDAENHIRSLAAVRETTRGVWQFLALSEDRPEYEERKALSLNALAFAANKHGLPVSELIEDFDRKFALLLEAKDFTVEIKDDDPQDKPKFNLNDKGGSDEDNDDKSESDKPGDDEDHGDDEEGDEDNGDKGGKPTSTEPHKKPSDGAMPGDDGGDGGDEEDSKDKGKDDDSDDSSDDDGGDDKPDFLNKGGSRRYASILARIEAGEDPTRWGRRVLAESENDDGGGAEGSGGAGASGMSSMPSGPSVGTAPTGQVTSTSPPQGTVTDTNSGSKGTKPVTAALISEIGQHNPHLPYREIVRIAQRVEAQYLSKEADGGDPLTYGDRGHVADGPLTHSVKNYQPPSPDQLLSGGGAAPGGGTDGESADGDDGDSDDSGKPAGHGGGGGSGLAGAAVGTAVKALPDLLLAASRKSE